MSQRAPKSGCRSTVEWVSLGVVHGLTLGFPMWYLLAFGGDVPDLLETARFRFMGRVTHCDPAEPVTSEPVLFAERAPPVMRCVPVARHRLEPGTTLSAEHVEYRAFFPDQLPERALQQLPPGATIGEMILPGELLREERLR